MMTLEGKRGLVMGLANRQSIAFGCAAAFRAAGAELALTYTGERTRPHVAPLAEALDCDLLFDCDVSVPGRMAEVFQALDHAWGQIDFCLHAIAFCPREDLHGPVIDCSLEGFSTAMAISCHSFIAMARLARPRMTQGGALLTVSYYGAEKVVPHYNIMGPVKAALEATVRYMASDLGHDGIRVNALSPGPIRTRAASGLAHFDALIEQAKRDAPQHQLVTVEDVGALATFLAGDGARHITGAVIPVDGGFHAVT